MRSDKSKKDDATMDDESFSNITVDAYIEELCLSARDSQVQKLENMLSKGKFSFQISLGEDLNYDQFIFMIILLWLFDLSKIRTNFFISDTNYAILSSEISIVLNQTF